MSANPNNGRVIPPGNLNGGLMEGAIRLLLTPTGPCLAAIVGALWRWSRIDPDGDGRPAETFALSLVICAALVCSVLTTALATIRERWQMQDARRAASQGGGDQQREG